MNEQNLGWKNGSDQSKMSWVNAYCKNPDTIESAVVCLDKGTFNLSETVGKKVGKLDIHSLAWTEDVTASFEGTLFYTLIYRVIVGN